MAYPRYTAASFFCQSLSFVTRPTARLGAELLLGVCFIDRVTLAENIMFVGVVITVLTFTFTDSFLRTVTFSV